VLTLLQLSAGFYTAVVAIWNIWALQENVKDGTCSLPPRSITIGEHQHLLFTSLKCMCGTEILAPRFILFNCAPSLVELRIVMTVSFVEYLMGLICSIVVCRLIFESSRRQTLAYVEHSSGKKVVMASTRELAIMRHLHRFIQPWAVFSLRNLTETDFDFACDIIVWNI